MIELNFEPTAKLSVKWSAIVWIITMISQNLSLNINIVITRFHCR